jgi:hypothetical protein
MTRILKLAAIFLSVISLVSAQFVETLNTPLGPVTQGAKVSITWTLISDPGQAAGDLSATDMATQSVVPIDPKVPLAPKSYIWEVKVPPGTYTLGLNDGSGLKQSGEVVVKAPAGGAPAPAPPAGGPPAGGAPAPPPAAAVSGGAGDTPAAAGSPTSAGTSSSDTPKTGSASSIFSGYEIVFSLLGVAIAMVQF